MTRPGGLLGWGDEEGVKMVFVVGAAVLVAFIGYALAL